MSVLLSSKFKERSYTHDVYDLYKNNLFNIQYIKILSALLLHVITI